MLLTIGAAAQTAGLTPKAVRLYEARGLLPDVKRSEGGYRLYDEEDLRLLRFIGRARALGLGLRAIQDLVEFRRGQTPSSREILSILDASLHDIDHRLSELRALRSTLAEVFGQARSAMHNGQAVRLCKIINT